MEGSPEKSTKPKKKKGLKSKICRNLSRVINERREKLATNASENLEAFASVFFRPAKDSKEADAEKKNKRTSAEIVMNILKRSTGLSQNLSTINQREILSGRENQKGYRIPSTCKKDAADIYQKTEEPKSFGGKILDNMFLVTLEPFVCLFNFAIGLQTIGYHKLFEERSCLLNTDYGHNLCKDDTHQLHLKHEVIESANLYQMLCVITYGVLIAFTTILYGSWGDKYGRKIPVMLAVISAILEIGGNIIFELQPKAHLPWMLGPAILAGMLGGRATLLASTYSYITEVSKSTSRPLRFTILHVSTAIGLPLGILAGEFMLDICRPKKDNLPVFVMSIAYLTMALTWVVVVFRNVRRKHKIETSTSEKCRYLFSVDHIVDIWKCWTMKRTDNVRRELWLLILASTLMGICQGGAASQTTQFTQDNFMWCSGYNNMIQTFSSITGAIAVLLLVPIAKKFFKTKDYTLALMGISSQTLAVFLWAMPANESLFLVGHVASIFSCLGHIAIHSRISNLVSNKEIGKIFTVVAFTETASLSFLSSLLFQKLYNSSKYTGLSFAICTILLLIPLGILIYLSRKRTSQYSELDEDSDVEVGEEVRQSWYYDFESRVLDAAVKERMKIKQS